MRQTYSAISAKYAKIAALKGGKAPRLTQSTLMLTKPISATTTNYSFDVLDSQVSTLQGNEIRLNQNDEFTVTHIGIFLQGIANTGGTKLMSYAPFELDAVKSGTLGGLYDGSLRISVNNVVFIDKWDLRKHEVVPMKQHNALVGTTLPAGIAQFASKEYLYPLDPFITLSGARKNEISISLPVALTGQTFTMASGTGTYSVVIDRIAVMLRGLNAQNAASFQS